MRLGVCVVAALLGIAGTAQAQSVQRAQIGEVITGYAFYNRPGATPAEHDGDLTECFANVPMDRPTLSSPIGGVANDLATNLLWGGVVQGLYAVTGENCMIARGWRVYQLPNAEGEAIYNLSSAEFRERVGPILGSPTPPGTFYRSFNNEAAHPANYGTASRPNAPSRRHLSVRFATEGGAQIGISQATPPALTRAPQIRAERTTTVPVPQPGNAVLVFMVRGGSHGITFQQVGSGEDSGQRTVFGMMGNRQGRWHVVEVPAGRWRISQTFTLSHCLGSPSLEAAAGEVIYGGDFDLAGPNLGPRLDLAEATAALQGPGLGSMRVAQYQNGSVTPCNIGVVPYPLEIDGAPFAPDYHWGSQAPGRSPR